MAARTDLDLYTGTPRREVNVEVSLYILARWRCADWAWALGPIHMP
jgi:hypothetical protein